jgi:predicted small lipoprotein YifL
VSGAPMEPHPMTRRWLVLAVLALPLAACGKKAGLRLPDKTAEEPAATPDATRDPETVDETDRGAE